MILNETKDYLFIALGLAIYTIAFTVFLMPYQIVAGGVTGLSAIIYYATGFHLENTYIIINGILLVVALKILGWKFLMNHGGHLSRDAVFGRILRPHVFPSADGAVDGRMAQARSCGSFPLLSKHRPHRPHPTRAVTTLVPRPEKA